MSGQYTIEQLNEIAPVPWTVQHTTREGVAEILDDHGNHVPGLQDLPAPIADGIARAVNEVVWRELHRGTP